MPNRPSSSRSRRAPHNTICATLRHMPCPPCSYWVGGRTPSELNWSRGVAIHEETHHIFVANYLNDRVEIFSETGEFFYQLGVGQLSDPWGIAIHGDSVYVSCWGDDDTVSKFSLT